MQIWFTGMDPRTKKGYQYEYWWNLNNVWSFANYVESILIYYFEKCIIVMTTSMENGYKISRDSVLYLQLFSICKLILKLEVCLVLLLFSHSVMSKSLQPMSDPWTVAHQGPLFTGLLRQEYWCGLPFPSPGHLPYQGIKCASPASSDGFSTTEPPGKPEVFLQIIFKNIRKIFMIQG